MHKRYSIERQIIFIYIYNYTHIYIYMLYIYIYVRVCMCVHIATHSIRANPRQPSLAALLSGAQPAGPQSFVCDQFGLLRTHLQEIGPREDPRGPKGATLRPRREEKLRIIPFSGADKHETCAHRHKDWGCPKLWLSFWFPPLNSLMKRSTEEEKNNPPKAPNLKRNAPPPPPKPQSPPPAPPKRPQPPGCRASCRAEVGGRDRASSSKAWPTWPQRHAPGQIEHLSRSIHKIAHNQACS